jgi:IclR family KDG regulon transcriptional repressor
MDYTTGANGAVRTQLLFHTIDLAWVRDWQQRIFLDIWPRIGYNESIRWKCVLSNGTGAPMNETVRSVERALAILGCFDDDHPLLGITEISAQLNLPKSTIHRILATLEAWGFVQQDEVSCRYQLGLRLFELGAIVGNSLGLRQAALPVLKQLSRETEETVLLVAYDSGEVVYLDALECPQPVKIDARPGKRLPAHCTASGKAFLSALPREEVERVLSRPLSGRTPKTITDAEELRCNLTLSRQRGYSISDEEYNTGIRAVAAPIVSEKGRVWGVVAVAGPAFRLSDDAIRNLGEHTVAAARRISERIRGRGGHLGV